MRRPTVFLALPMVLFLNCSGQARAAEFFPLGDLPGGGFESLAGDISRDGSVVVGTSEGFYGLEAFRWTHANGMESLYDSPVRKRTSYAMSVSADGSVVFGTTNTTEGYNLAFRWTETGEPVLLGLVRK